MKFFRRIRGLIGKGRFEAEMAEEMRLHLEQRTTENISNGLSPDEARYAALRKFGGMERAKELCREQRGWLWLEHCGQDLGYAVRQMLHAPVFALTVIVTLALGIGACTVVFTAINTTLLHPSDAPEPERNVLIHETQLPQRPQMAVSLPTFLDIQQQAKSFAVVSAWAGARVVVQGVAEPLEVRAAMVTLHGYDYWGVSAALGRLFGPADYAANAPRRIVLSYSLWQRAFGGDPSIIGRVVNVDDVACTVVGVMSSRFARFGSDLDLFQPLIITDQERRAPRGQHFLMVQARLKPDVTLGQAQAELDLVAANLARQYPDTNKGCGLLVRNFGTYLNRNMAPMLHILLGAVACVLLIVCANVANLLLARATVRQREISIRAALGAGRGRIVRQLLAESLLFAILGGVGGVVLAEWGLHFVRIYGPAAGTDMARLAYVELEPDVLLFTIGFSLLTGLVFGLAPAWLSSRIDLNEALKAGARGSTDGRARNRLRNLLVVVEVALALVLLTGAGLLVRSFAELARLNPGFVIERVAAMRVTLNGRKYGKPDQRVHFAQDFLERVRRLPEVESAAVTNLTPFDQPGTLPFRIVGQAPGVPGRQPSAVPYFVSHEYFQALRLRLVRGRFFNAQDGITGPVVFAINETLAHQVFPNEDPIGKQIQLGWGNRVPLAGEIVGIVADVVQGDPGAPRPPQLYAPWARLGADSFILVARTTSDPHTTLGLLKSELYAIDKDQPIGSARTLEDLMDDRLARPHLMLRLLGAFGVIALLIAGVGIYGVMAYLVSQRTSEFGIRMALGASRGNILRQLLRHGMELVGSGLVIGLFAALQLGQVVQSLLYNTSPRDPLTLSAIVAALVIVALAACLLPAWRATKVDPMVALRCD